MTRNKGWFDSSTTKMKQIDNSAAPWNKFLTTCVQPECHVNVEQPGNQGSSYVQDHTHNLARSNLQINQLAGLGDLKPWAQGTSRCPKAKTLEDDVVSNTTRFGSSLATPSAMAKPMPMYVDVA